MLGMNRGCNSPARDANAVMPGAADGLPEPSGADFNGRNQSSAPPAQATRRSQVDGDVRIEAHGFALDVMVDERLLKFAALQALSADAACAALLLVPALGRAVIVALLLTTPYVRPAGLGAPYAAYLPRQWCGLLLALLAATTVVVSGWAGTGVLVGLGIGVIGLRQALMRRLGGITGDTLGAACELTEMAALLVLALA